MKNIVVIIGIVLLLGCADQRPTDPSTHVLDEPQPAAEVIHAVRRGAVPPDASHQTGHGWKEYVQTLEYRICYLEKQQAEYLQVWACYRNWFEERGLQLNHDYGDSTMIIGRTPECIAHSLDLRDCGE